jgi:TonB family protein
MGSLDKEIIRRVIKENLSQIRYCYERELAKSPGLYGKVQVKFIIAATGLVSNSQVDESTMKNANVEQCIVQKVRGWRFPKPKGGGIVIVTYPFIFKQSG